MKLEGDYLFEATVPEVWSALERENEKWKRGEMPAARAS